MCKLAVLISGAGSNLAAIAEATATGRLRAEIVLVIFESRGRAWAGVCARAGDRDARDRS
jgi:folate-dependent phosphoribosylglycinamide formyltransferase PurN